MFASGKSSQFWNKEIAVKLWYNSSSRSSAASFISEIANHANGVSATQPTLSYFGKGITMVISFHFIFISRMDHGMKSNKSKIADWENGISAYQTNFIVWQGYCY